MLPMTSRFFFIFQHFITCLIYLKHFIHFQHWICVSDIFLTKHHFSIKGTVAKFCHWHLAHFKWNLNKLLFTYFITRALIKSKNK